MKSLKSNKKKLALYVSRETWFGRKAYLHPSRHGCVSDASLRRLIQRLRDISKRTICKSLRHLPGD